MRNEKKIIIRNIQLSRNILDNREKLKSYYKLSRYEIEMIQELCLKHNSYHPYIRFKRTDFDIGRKTFYRYLDKLENENIINLVSRPLNNYKVDYQVYFTLSFIKEICSKEFYELYVQWFNILKENNKEI